MSVRIFVDGQKILDVLDERGWVQGSWSSFGQVCLHGAIRLCAAENGDAYLIEAVAREQGWGTGWNDKNTTTETMVRQRAHRGIYITDQNLEDTFGPQWRACVAFVRRIAALTSEEIRALPVGTFIGRNGANPSAVASATERERHRNAMDLSVHSAMMAKHRDDWVIEKSCVYMHAAADAVVLWDVLTPVERSLMMFGWWRAGFETPDEVFPVEPEPETYECLTPFGWMTSSVQEPALVDA